MFALRSGRVAIFTPLMVGFVVGSFALNVLERVAAAVHQITDVEVTLGAALAALATTLVTSSLMGRRMPDRLEISPVRLALLRGSRVIRQVDLRMLREVSEIAMPLGSVLLVADNRRQIMVQSAELENPREYEEITRTLVEVLERIDPSGAMARGAARTGRLRAAIAQQPVRGTPVLAGFVALASILAFSTRSALARVPFPEETMGALSAPLVLSGQFFRIFSYLFIHESAMHLAVVTAGILYIGAFLEKLLGWERVVLGFVAGAVGGAAGHMLLCPSLPAVGASGALFGLLGMLGAVATVKRRLPPTLVPHWSFWITSLLLALLLPTTSELQPEVFVGALRGVHLGGAVFGYLAGLVLVIGTDIPAPPSARYHAMPFAVLGAAALVIGVAATIWQPHRPHIAADGIVLEALEEMPKSADSAHIQNELAHERLDDPSSDKSVVEIYARIADAAAKNSDHKDPRILDTLARARYRQGDPEDAREILREAMKLQPDPSTAKTLRQLQEDIDSGGELHPGSELDR